MRLAYIARRYHARRGCRSW